MDKKKRKSKNIIRSLFIFLAILILVLIGATVYFYLTGEGDFFPEDEEIVTCACYYIDPEVTTTCGDPKRAFKFNTAEGPIDTCSVTCPASDLSTNMLYSTTPQEAYLTCNVKVVPNTQCSSMEITTEDGLTVTGKIPPEVPINVKATFDSEEYTDHQFLINNVPTEPDEINGTTISITISDYQEASTLQITAQATDKKGETVGSDTLCKRLLEITTSASAGVSELSIDTYPTNQGTKIRSITITAGGLQQEAENEIRFTFEEQSLTMTDGFEVQPTSGKISITEVELYDSENFSSTSSFDLLNNFEGEIEISAEVIQQGTSLGTATTTIILEEAVEDPGKEEEEEEEQDEEEPPVEEEEEEPTATESLFTVGKNSSVSCVERVSPNNVAEFSITITNSSETTDTIESVKDKLPLGFAYIPESSTLDGEAIADSVFVTTTDVGESQEIVWEPQNSWSINGGGTLTLVFEASVGDNALTGENLNEVIVTPTEIPEDPSTLRASKSITVAQDCEDIQPEEETPQTGIFDTTFGRIAFGIGIILIGIIIHNSSQGNRLAHMVINTGAYRDAEMTSYKLFNPKKYFEEKILERRERKR